MISCKDIFFQRLHKLYSISLSLHFQKNLFLLQMRVLIVLWRIWFYLLSALPVILLFPILAILLIFPNGYRPFFWIARNIWSRSVLLGTGFWITKKFKTPLDPVYTGKLLFGIFDLIKKKQWNWGKRILIIHTGGLQGISGMNQMLSKKKWPVIEV